MNSTLIKQLKLKNNNEIIEIIYKSELYIEDMNDLVELFTKFNINQLKQYHLNIDNILELLKNIDIKNFYSLMNACRLMHKQKREVMRLLKNEPNNDNLKSFARLCSIGDRSCYKILKENHNIVRTVSQNNDEIDFCKY